MTLKDRLEKYGNYKTVKPDWDKFEGEEQFEIVGGNASLRDEAIKAIAKDIEQIIGEDETPYSDVPDFMQYKPVYQNRNKLRQTQRQALKEYIG